MVKKDSERDSFFSEKFRSAFYCPLREISNCMIMIKETKDTADTKITRTVFNYEYLKMLVI